MIITLENDLLTVAIEDAGAQLASIRDREGTEYLWQGDPDIWPRRAPLLFPIIGRLKDSQYTLEGTTYTIPTHGFCRSAPFTVVEQDRSHAVFQYADTPETRQAYPFSFLLTVTYTLERNRLTKSHRVENRSGVEMLYELGGHDGFRAPLRPGEKMADYAIRLPGLDIIRPYGMDAQCMTTLKEAAYPLKDGRVPLSPAAYDLDTIILDQPPQAKAVLVDSQDCPRVTLEFQDFPYLGIWTANKPFDTGYICIEPWTTLPDAVFVGRGLADKRGIRTLAPGQSEVLTYITTFD